MSDLVSLKKASDILGYPPEYMNRLAQTKIKKGDNRGYIWRVPLVRSARIGNRIFFPEDELHRLINTVKAYSKEAAP